MAARTKVALSVLWLVSLFAVAEWSAHAQGRQPPGLEVRFLQSQGQKGIFIADFGGQWLPVETVTMPDANKVVR